MLGSECVDFDAPCLVLAGRDAAVALDASQALDASSEVPASDADSPEPVRDADAEQADAEEIEEAGIAEIEVELSVANPSFERGGGLAGDVVLNNLIGTLLPIPPVTLIFAQLPNWYACWWLSVNSLSRDVADAGSIGGYYLSFVINGTAVRQALANPMQEGVSYAFEMDVVSRSEGSENLFVEVRGAHEQCGNASVLGRSPTLRDDSSWTTTCVRFTATDNYTHIVVAPGYEGTAPNDFARLWLDNLRQVASCPGE